LLLALALETHQTDTALNLANEFGGLAKVLEISDEAWRWAAEATGHSHAAPQE
jgi:hypothetical protein